MQYRSVGGTIIVNHEIRDDLTLTFAAEEVSLSPRGAGVRARVRILINGVMLAWGMGAIERDEERARLASTTWEHLAYAGVVVDFPKPYLRFLFDQFCSDLWTVHVGAQMPHPVAGATTHRRSRLIAPAVVEAGGTLLFGPPERGKSWLLLALAVSMDAGVQSLWPVDHRPVLLVNLERSADSMADRLGAVNRCLGLPSERPLLMLNAKGRSLADVAAVVAQARVDLGERAVLALDSLSRAGAGDLNDNRTANAVTDQLNALAPTWVAVAHTPRSDASHVFGSVHFEAGADVTAQVLSEVRGDERGIAVQVSKANDLPPQRTPTVIALRFDDEDGLVAIRRAQLAEFPEMGLGVMRSRLDQVVDALRELGGHGTASAVAESSGLPPATVARLLATSERFVRLPREGRRVPYGLVGPP